MKLYIKHMDTVRVKDIIDKLVNAAGRSVMMDKPDLDRELIDQVVKVVKGVMSDTMDTLLLGSSSTVVEFEIENAVGQTFENVVKMIKADWDKERKEMEKELSDSEPENNDQV